MASQNLIEWRKDQVIRLSSKGHNAYEISKILDVDVTTIYRDIKFLREQAKDNIRTYLNEILPHEFEKAVKALEEVQKEAWEISSAAEDKKLKLQALALAKDATVQKVDLLTNTETIDNAISFVKDAQKKSAGVSPAQKEKGEHDTGAAEEQDKEPEQFHSTF